MKNGKLTALALTLALATSPAAFAISKGNKGKANGKNKSKHETSIDSEFSRYDANRDGVVSRSEFPADSSLFDVVDTNRDGVLSRSEAGQALDHRGELENRVRQLDTNRDGVISRGEWRGDVATFDRLDRDRDGVLSQADRGGARNNATRQQRHRGMDTNRDGVVTRDEWRGNTTSFRQLDTNGDNVLSGAELRRGNK